MNLTNEILLFHHFLIMHDFVLLYYLHFVFYCTHVRMSYVLNSYLLSSSKKKLAKQQYLLHMSPQYGELQPTSG